MPSAAPNQSAKTSECNIHSTNDLVFVIIILFTYGRRVSDSEPVHAMHPGVDDDTILWRSRKELIPNLELKCESRELSGLEEAGLPTMMN